MKTILVIDDNDVFLFIIADWLRNEGFHPITAEDGFAGIQLAQSHVPDLILCDVNMPEMDGVEVLKQLRSDRNTSHIPFFFLTSDNSFKISFVQDLGANGVILKAEEFDGLRRAINSIEATEPL